MDSPMISLFRQTFSVAFVKSNSMNAVTYWCICASIQERNLISASTVLNALLLLEIEMTTNADTQTRNPICAMRAAYDTTVSTSLWSTLETNMSIWWRQILCLKFPIQGLSTKPLQVLTEASFPLLWSMKMRFDYQILKALLRTQILLTSPIPFIRMFWWKLKSKNLLERITPSLATSL